ncbi:MAG: hydroxyacid dehydrogenase [Candidatus Hadarchaeum sp.]
MVNILITDKIDEEGIRRLKEVANVDLAIGLKPPELLERIKNYEVLVVRSATKVTKEVIEAGKKLRIIGRAGAGVDNIDVEAAKARGIKVLNTPEAPTEAVAELVIGLMLSWARRLPQADSSMKQGKWLKSELMGTELRGKTLGIIGTGKIGQRVGSLAVAFGMKIVAQDCVVYPEFIAKTSCEYTDLDTVLKQADYLTIHLPLTPETRHLIGRRELGLMKSTAVLINTSRGEIVDENALIEALTGGKIAGACLDVFSREPPVDSPLLKLSNVILTPHIGASTHEAQKEAAILISEKIKEAIA